MQARILIVDDNSLARTTIRGYRLAFISGVRRGHSKEAIEKVAELKPDIVLLDINMLVMDGFTAAPEIGRISPLTKIVFLSLHDAPAVVQRTRLWAHEFVSKAAAGTELRILELVAKESETNVDEALHRLLAVSEQKRDAARQELINLEGPVPRAFQKAAFVDGLGKFCPPFHDDGEPRVGTAPTPDAHYRSKGP